MSIYRNLADAVCQIASPNTSHKIADAVCEIAADVLIFNFADASAQLDIPT